MNHIQIEVSEATSDFKAIEAVLHGYFEGLYHGDVAKLVSIFHPDTWLKAPGVRRSLNQWLRDVAERRHQQSSIKRMLLKY